VLVNSTEGALASLYTSDFVRFVAMATLMVDDRDEAAEVVQEEGVVRRADSLRRTRTRRTHAGWAIAGVVPVLLITIFVVGHRSRTISTADAPPAPVVVWGARSDQPTPLDSTQSLVIAFSGSSPAVGRDDPCFIEYHAVASETSSTVTLAVSAVGTEMTLENASSCIMNAASRTAVVTLAAPLGRRPVVDAATGKALSVFDSSTELMPTTLPDGWTKQSETGIETGAGPAWTSSYGTFDPNSKLLPPDGTPLQWLSVVQTPDRAMPTGLPPEAAVEPAAVGELPADYFASENVHVLSWWNGSRLVRLSASSYSPWEPLKMDELVSIAENMQVTT